MGVASFLSTIQKIYTLSKRKKRTSCAREIIKTSNVSQTESGRPPEKQFSWTDGATVPK